MLLLSAVTVSANTRTASSPQLEDAPPPSSLARALTLSYTPSALQAKLMLKSFQLFFLCLLRAFQGAQYTDRTFYVGHHYRSLVYVSGNR